MICGIYTNIKRDINGVATAKFINILKEKNINFLLADVCKVKGVDGYSLDYVIEHSSIMVSFGGDGTMLECVSHCSGKNVPILGINMGNLGFLTELGESEEEMRRAVDLLHINEYFTEERSMLEVECEDEITTFALNEMVFGSGISSKISEFSIYIDGILADTLRADGIIVSTPTGSTAYNLSCGGAILSPDVNAFIVNAICPHSLHSAPMVISDRSEVLIEGKGDLKVLLDGKNIYKNKKVSTVKVRKSNISAKFIRFEKVNFFNLLVKKMSKWR